MKHLKLIIILLIAFSNYCVAQNGVSAAFNINQTQFNYALNYTRDFGKHHTFGLGFKILHKINNTPTTPDAPDNLKHMFKHRFYPNKLSQFLGFDFSYQFNFKLKNSCIEPFAFYNYQYTYSSLLVDVYTNHFTPDFYFLFKADEILKDIQAHEQNIGFGFNIKISDKLLFYTKIGTGLAIYHHNNIRLMYGLEEDWEVSTMFGNGFIYKF